MSPTTLPIFECSAKGAIGKETDELFTVPEFHAAQLRRAVGIGELIGAVRIGGSIAYVVQFPWMVRRVLFNFGRY